MLTFSKRPFTLTTLALFGAVCAALAACGGGADDGSAVGNSANRAMASTLGASIAVADAGAASVAGAASAAAPAEVNAVPSDPAPGALAQRRLFVEPANPSASDSNPGSKSAPLKTIGQAMKLLSPGDEVIIGPGVYRESIVIPALVATSTPTILRARVAGTAIIKGSDLVSGWVNTSPGIWSVDWTGDEPEQVFRAGVALQQIGGTVFDGYPSPGHALDAANPWPGRVAGDRHSLPVDAFTYDAAERRLYVRLGHPMAPGEALEVSTRTYVLRAESAQRLVVKNLVFEHSNTSFTSRHGAVYVTGTDNVIRNSTIRLMDAFCVMLDGNRNQLLDSTVADCGQAGISAGGARVRVQGNRVTGNNTRGFRQTWEAGGMKFTGTPALKDSIVSGNTVLFNNGDGIWFDWTPRRVTIQGNVCAYNVRHGIHFEASQSSTIDGNVAYGNGLRGIYLLESAHNVVSGNIAFGNEYEGIAVADDTRSADNPALRPYGNVVTDNTSAWNDPHRNRVQLMLPGEQWGALSDRNVLIAGDVVPRYLQGWMRDGLPYYDGLAAWRAATGQDYASIESRKPMPDSLRAGLAERREFVTGELPVELQTAGVR